MNVGIFLDLGLYYKKVESWYGILCRLLLAPGTHLLEFSMDENLLDLSAFYPYCFLSQNLLLSSMNRIAPVSFQFSCESSAVLKLTV